MKFCLFIREGQDYQTFCISVVITSFGSAFLSFNYYFFALIKIVSPKLTCSEHTFRIWFMWTTMRWFNEKWALFLRFFSSTAVSWTWSAAMDQDKALKNVIKFWWYSPKYWYMTLNWSILYCIHDGGQSIFHIYSWLSKIVSLKAKSRRGWGWSWSVTNRLNFFSPHTNGIP